MNEHQRIREILPLAAAGLLAPGELGAVEQHAATCSDCRRELELSQLYAKGLRELPQPMLPVGLLQRTRARIIQERAAAAERRGRDLVLGLLAAFSWIMGGLSWLFVRAVFHTNFTNAAAWSLASTLLVWTTAGVAVVILGRHKELGRRAL